MIKGHKGIFLNEYEVNQPFIERKFLIDEDDVIEKLREELEKEYPNSEIRILPRTVSIKIFKSHKIESGLFPPNEKFPS